MSGTTYALVLALALLGGCSDDSAPFDAGPGADSQPTDALPTGDAQRLGCKATLGAATASGAVAGQDVKASHAAGYVENALFSAYVVVLVEQAGTCALANDPKLATLTIVLCARKPGTYAIGDSCAGGKGLEVKNTIAVLREGKKVKADSGSVSLKALEETCGGELSARFSASFGADAVSGSFKTVNCGN